MLQGSWQQLGVSGNSGTDRVVYWKVIDSFGCLSSARFSPSLFSLFRSYGSIMLINQQCTLKDLWLQNYLQIQGFSLNFCFCNQTLIFHQKLELVYLVLKHLIQISYRSTFKSLNGVEHSVPPFLSYHQKERYELPKKNTTRLRKVGSPTPSIILVSPCPIIPLGFYLAVRQRR